MAEIDVKIANMIKKGAKFPGAVTPKKVKKDSKKDRK